MKPHIKGMFAGWALWAVLYAIGYGYLTGHAFLPGIIGFAAAVASMPIGFGGWLWLGQGGTYIGLLLDIAVCLVVYGALGAMAGAIIARFRKPR